MGQGASRKRCKPGLVILPRSGRWRRMKASLAWWTPRPTWLNMAKRSLFGLAPRYSSSKATAFIRVSRFAVSTCRRSQAASAPNFPLGQTPAASSSFRMWWVCSMVPALPRCRSRRDLPSVCQSFVTTAKVLTPLPSLKRSPWAERIRIAR